VDVCGRGGCVLLGLVEVRDLQAIAVGTIAVIYVTRLVALVSIRHQPHFIWVGFEGIDFIYQITLSVVH